MLLSDIFTKILVESGQFLITEGKVELREGNFKVIVEKALGVLNKYSPIDEHIVVDLSGNPRQHTFTDIDVFSPRGIPEEISTIIPFRVSGVRPFFLRDPVRINPELDVKEEFPWLYRKPTLTVPLSAKYEVHAIYNHVVVSSIVNDITVYDATSITVNDTTFFDLLTAFFLQGIGRSRRMFTLSDLPVISDGGDLVAEGETKEEKAMEKLTENEHKFYLAYT